MYKRGKKLCSTPVKVESRSTSLSLSDIKPNSSESASLANAIRPKKLERTKNVDRKKKKRKKKFEKYKELVRKIRKKEWTESHASDSEWEVQYSPNNSRVNEYEAMPPLFESPVRQRDLGVERDYVLSPSLIDPRGRNLPAIEDGFFDKEEEEKYIFSLDEDKIETDVSSPTFERSKFVRTYPSKKKENWEEKLLTNKGSGDWLIDVKIPTATADLLWRNYIEDHLIELPQLRIDDIAKLDPRDKRNDEDNDTDSDDTLVILNEKRNQPSNSKKLCKIKGSCSKTNGEFSMEVRQFVKVNGQWKKWITKRDKFTDIRGVSRTDPDLREENGTLMSFNEFHARSKRKRNKDIDCPSQRTSNVKIRSIVKLKAIVYKRSDQNFGMIVN